MSYAYPPRPDPSPGLLGYLLPLLLGMVLAAGGLLLGAKFLARNDPPPTDPNAKEREAAPRTGFDGDEQEAIRVFKETKPSVVNVDTLIVRQGMDFRIQEQQAGTGSGFVWDTDGRIVTNFHVIQEALRSGRTVRVVTADRTAHTAAIVGVSPQHDTAVLQITAKDKLKPIRVGRSNDLEVGQRVYAIGNPFGLSLTLTKGIVSALDRTIDSPANTDITGAIQVDAPINPGNSGGPLLDKDGRLIGMNTAITSPSGGNVGIGFAIPVDTVNEVVTELIRNGRIPKPDLGIKLVEERVLRRSGFPRGVMVETVSPSGPAAKADVQGVRAYGRGAADPGDLIVAMDGEPVTSVADYQRLLAKHKPGDEVTLRILRGKRESDVTLTVQGV